jgi:hypothetical protein
MHQHHARAPTWPFEAQALKGQPDAILGGHEFGCHDPFNI